MRQQRVDLQAVEDFLGRLALLDDSDAIDDGVRSESGKHFDQMVRRANIDLRESIGLAEQAKTFIRAERSSESDANVVRRSENGKKLVAKHSVAAQDQYLHAT